MKIRALRLSLLPLCLGLISPWLSADEPLGKAADNKIFAQKLLNQLVAANSDLYIVGFHSVAPGAKAQTMIACNLDRIGKTDEPDDLEVFAEHQTRIARKLDDPKKLVVMTPLKDASYKVVGTLVMIFDKFKEGETEEQYYLRSMKLRDTLAKKIPDQAALFGAAD